MGDKPNLHKLVRKLMSGAAVCRAEILTRWPGDTPYDGCEEEATAAYLEGRAEVYEETARKLAEALGPEG